MASILGILGTIVGLVRALPQLIRLIRAKKAFGVSVDTAATSSIVSFGWATYGLLTHQPYVTLATGFSGVIFLLVAYFALRFGRHINEFKIAPIWFCLLVLAGVLAKENGLGIILPISVLAANIPQLVVAYKEDNLVDLSLGTWLLSLTDGLVWGTYSIIQQDYSIMAYAFFQLSTSSIIVVRKKMNQKSN